MAATCPSCNAEVQSGVTTCPACHSAVVAKPANNVIAALTYLLGVATGILFLYLEPYDKDEYVRFHARQSIAFSVAWFALNIVIGVFVAVLPRALGGLLGFIQQVMNLGVAVLWVYLMYQAYTGNKYRVPVLADWVESSGL